MAKHTTIARMAAEDHMDMEYFEVGGRFRISYSRPYVRKFQFALDGDRWRHNFQVTLVVSQHSRPDGEPMMTTQSMLERGDGSVVYGDINHRYDMGWKGAMYREHWVLDGYDTVILDLRHPADEDVHLYKLQQKFAAVCPP